MTDFNLRKIRPYWEHLAERELGETPEVKARCLAELRHLLKEDSLLRCPMSDTFLLKFLRCRKYKVERALKNIRAYFRARTDYPEYFEGLRPDSIDYDSLVRKHRLVMVLEERDRLGRAICCLKLGAWNTSICSMTELIRAVITFVECSLLDEETQVTGGILLVDYTGFHFGHLRHIVPILRRSVLLIQDCYPLRFKGIYAINCPALVEVFIALFKPFLNSKLLNRIHIVRDNYRTLHDAVSPELLPPEFGGTCHAFDFDTLEANIQSKHNYFEEMQKYGYLA